MPQNFAVQLGHNTQNSYASRFSALATKHEQIQSKFSMISAGSHIDAVVDHGKNFIFNKYATAREILPIVLMFAVLWYVIFYILKKVIREWVHNKKWLIEALERDYERSTKKTFKELNMNMTKEEAIQWGMNDWPRLQCIYLQHFIGSLFCVPSLLRIGDPHVTSSLACLGVLSEMGWEVQDMAEIFFIRTFHGEFLVLLQVLLFRLKFWHKFLILVD